MGSVCRQASGARRTRPRLVPAPAAGRSASGGSRRRRRSWPAGSCTGTSWRASTGCAMRGTAGSMSSWPTRWASVRPTCLQDSGAFNGFGIGVDHLQVFCIPCGEESFHMAVSHCSWYRLLLCGRCFAARVLQGFCKGVQNISTLMLLCMRRQDHPDDCAVGCIAVRPSPDVR